MKSMGFKLLLAAAAVSLISLLPVGRAPRGSAQTVRPNIVIIMTDDQNVDSLPVMRKLMSYPEGSWVNFTNAIANDSICCPARATVLTGQYAHVTGVTSNGNGHLLNDANTLPVWLDSAGYRTGLIGKYLNGYPWDKGTSYVPPGWDTFRTSGVGKSDVRTTIAIDFINAAPGPFFLYLAYSEPHAVTVPLPQYANAAVYVPPDPPNFNEADVSDKPVWVRSLPLISQATIDEWHAERINSQRSLLGVDDGIQRIVDALKANGQLENTMIIFLGDHGFSWGSHRYIKKECVYEECIRIPLFIRYPGLAGSREENRIVSNVDLASTIANYAGVTTGLPQNGRSLIPLITNPAITWNEEAFIEAHDRLSRTFDGIRVPGWVYAEYGNGDKELYDLNADPYQLANKANDPAYQSIQDELTQRTRALKYFFQSGTATPTPDNSTPPPTATPTDTPTGVSTGEPTLIPTDSPTPSITSTPPNTGTQTPSHTPTFTRTPTATATPSQTFTATRSPTPVTDLIFKDDFETGNLSAWSSSTTDGGDLSVNFEALTNNHRMQAVIDDNNAIYVTDDSPNAERRYRARFQFNPNSISMSGGDTHYIFYGYTGTSTIVLRVQLRYSNGSYQIRAALRNDSSTWTSSTWFTISNASHSIEIDWRASTASGANNGGLTVWIDGTQRADLAGIDNDTRRIDRVRLGAVTGIDNGTRGTYYFDSFESRRQTYIGP
jgi:N-acetylglucosamine-6-sulfatase